MDGTSRPDQASVRKGSDGAKGTSARAWPRLLLVRRRWYRLDSRWLIRPHQQDSTRGVVNYEPRGRPQAPRAEMRAGTVARRNQQIDVVDEC